VSTIASLGLGIMGKPMSERLIQAGHERLKPITSAVDHLVAAGGKGSSSVAEAVRGAEVIITMVPDSERKAGNTLAGNFEPGFRIDLRHKDMGIVIAAARERDVAIPLGALTAQLVGAVRAQGDGNLDQSALLRGVERLSGRTP
jgi:3-hydroxyisobutyrate dehydrogenase-like beta-hydroxyacid dehydrogenase